MLMLDCLQDIVLGSFSFKMGRHLCLIILKSCCSIRDRVVFQLRSKKVVGISMMRLRDFDCENIKIGKCLKQILPAEE